MKSYEEITKFLEQPIPRDEVSQRSGGGSKALPYLATWKVIDLLNEAFGNLGWDSETVSNTHVNFTDSSAKPTYVAKVRIKALVKVADGQFLHIVKEGTGYGVDKSGQNPHELASKEAESDALKRAAMKFGKRLGLALYDKTQEFISDEKTQDKAREVSAPASPGPARVEGVRSEPAPTVPAGTPRPSRDTILKSISTYSQVLLGKKLRSQEDLVKMVQAFQVKRKEDLNDAQAGKLLEQLKEICK
jgi:DNA recombination protein Rad52